jgi:hypothetical protein
VTKKKAARLTDEERVQNILAFINKLALEVISPVEALSLATAELPEAYVETIRQASLSLFGLADHGPDGEEGQLLLQKLREGVEKSPPEIKKQLQLGVRALFARTDVASALAAMQPPGTVSAMPMLPFPPPPSPSAMEPVTLWPPPTWIFSGALDAEYEDA